MTLHVVTLVTKEGCSLCDRVASVLQASVSRRHYDLRFAIMNENPTLESKYILRIPVVLVDGLESFEAKDMDPQGSWKGKLEDILAGLGQS